VVSKGSPPEAAKAAEAAVAVGWPGNDAAVPTLARALESDDARLRLAAIRGLSGIATAAARETLEKAAASHHDPAVRRRAAAAAGPRQQ
jgi:HEAT repeat protein